MSSKTSPFVRSKRLSDRVAAVERGFDKAVNRLGRWMDDREAMARDRQITRKAIKLKRELQESIDVLQRMTELKDEVI